MTPTTKIEPELPELPMQALSKWPGTRYFTDAQMRAYALSAIAADRAKRDPVAAGLSDEVVEREAKLLWNIFAASHHTEWDNEPNKAEYRNAARSILARALEARMLPEGKA